MSSPPLAFSGKALIHSVISHYLIYFFSMAISIELNFVSEVEREERWF